MIITWYGQSSVKIQSGEVVIAIDPTLRGNGAPPPRFKSDIALLTQAISKEEREKSGEGSDTFVITDPGEYEVRGIAIRGIVTYADQDEGRTYGLNTMYRILFEQIRILHMGYFGETELRSGISGEIGDIDILFVPVDGMLGAKGAAKIIRQIEPAIVIPIRNGVYHETKKHTGDPMAEFLKEMEADATAVEKFVVQKKEIKSGATTTFIVLNPQ